MIGQTISHYKILEKLGEGGMGVVYKAHDIKLDRTVALKFLPQYLTPDRKAQTRFTHEARAASSMNHPNITTIYEIDEFGGQVFIAMEYCEGKTLRQILQSDNLQVKQVIDMALQVCEGLALAHEKGIVHRDIKPENIMVTLRNQVKIMDFGLAKLKGSSKLTLTRSTLGTAQYMSPEQARGDVVDRRSDIFSIGIVLYEMLARQLPFRGEHQASITYAIMNEEPQPLARFNNQTSVHMQEIVTKALAKEREERYQHVDDLLADLRRERKNIETRTISQSVNSLPEVDNPVALKRKLVRYWIPAAGIVALLILMFVFNPFNLHIAPERGAAGEQNSIAVMYFENITDPKDREHTGEMLVNLLITSLSQIKNLDVISRERLYDIQKDLSHSDNRTIDPAIATRIAQRANVKTMLFGTILQELPAIAVTTRLVDVQSGRVLGSERLAGFSNDRIFALVDSLSSLVRADLNLPEFLAAEARPVADVTTPSPVAYRSYITGIELLAKYYNQDARAAFTRAIELDKNFAMAYYQFWRADPLLKSMNSSREALAKAYELRTQVTERERLQIEAAYARTFRNEFEGAATILEQFLQKYPHEIGAAIELQGIYSRLGKYDREREMLARALSVNPLEKELWNAQAYSLAGLGLRKEAMYSIDQYMRLAPGEPNPYDSKGEIFFIFGEVDSSLLMYQKAIDLRADFVSGEKMGQTALLRKDYDGAERHFRNLASTSDELQRMRAEVDLALIPIYQGRFAEARNILENLIASKEKKEFPPDHVMPLYSTLISLLYEQGDFASMVVTARDASRALHKRASDEWYGRDYIAWSLLVNGKSTMAWGAMDALRKDTVTMGPRGLQRIEYLQGFLAFLEGRYEEALAHFEGFASKQMPKHGPLYFHAVALMKVGRRTDALSELERLTWWHPIDVPPIAFPNLPTTDYWPIAAVKAHYWLGIGYEQMGEKAKAVREYQEFLDTWKNADREGPEMVDARTRLKNLSRNSTSALR
jgi:eukaryotic-like serine/threonine-protein kinase